MEDTNMGRGASQSWVKRILKSQAKKYSGVEFRVIYASNGETAILPVDPRTGKLTTENPRKLQVAALWDKMCQHDKVDRNSKFVVFSPTNPFTAVYNEAMALLQAEK
jgi:hypothetical protein